MDIIFPLGVSSKWNDNELRYSLRSIQKHVTGYNNVWIIGQRPDFLTNVHHIPFEDVSQNKEANICRKVLRACQESSLSDDFLFFNDDHFILQDFVADQLPYYYKGDLISLANSPRRGIYYRAIRRTVRELQKRGFDTKHFDTHTPIIYNKQKFVDVMSQYDWDVRIGLTVKSIYCNSLRIEGTKEPDRKINGLMMAQDVFEFIKDRKVFSIGDKALGPQMEIVLNTLYPTPSQWEMQA